MRMQNQKIRLWTQKNEHEWTLESRLISNLIFWFFLIFFFFFWFFYFAWPCCWFRPRCWEVVWRWIRGSKCKVVHQIEEFVDRRSLIDTGVVEIAPCYAQVSNTLLSKVVLKGILALNPLGALLDVAIATVGNGFVNNRCDGGSLHLSVRDFNCLSDSQHGKERVVQTNRVLLS